MVVLCSEGSESISESGQSHSERKWKYHFTSMECYYLKTKKLSNSLTYYAGESISELVSSVEQSGSKYTALYVSDPYWYTSYKTLQRFLAESATGNSTAGVSTTCDELCKFKSSLLEGILVVRSYSLLRFCFHLWTSQNWLQLIWQTLIRIKLIWFYLLSLIENPLICLFLVVIFFLQGIVFLLILISGLCCMAGIDTPTRFETPQDSWAVDHLKESSPLFCFAFACDGSFLLHSAYGEKGISMSIVTSKNKNGYAIKIPL